jgi:hypothetical protein
MKTMVDILTRMGGLFSGHNKIDIAPLDIDLHHTICVKEILTVNYQPETLISCSHSYQASNPNNLLADPKFWGD